MKKRNALKIVLSSVLVSFALVGAALAADSGSDAATNANPQQFCPVMGGPVSHDLYVDAEGKRIYVCCQACVAAVKANPHKYIEQMEASGITLEKVPVSQ